MRGWISVHRPNPPSYYGVACHAFILKPRTPGTNCRANMLRAASSRGCGASANEAVSGGSKRDGPRRHHQVRTLNLTDSSIGNRVDS
ncbi:hypothetical protein VTK26DRAFT_5544 [Humicola hyalothermophila]